MNRKLTEAERDEIREAVKHGIIVQEDPATSALVTLMEREADAEILGGVVTLRWGRRQIDVVKRAAAIIGVPYQTYLKQVVFSRALEDIARAEAVLPKDEVLALEDKPKAARARKSATSAR